MFYEKHDKNYNFKKPTTPQNTKKFRFLASCHRVLLVFTECPSLLFLDWALADSCFLNYSLVSLDWLARRKTINHDGNSWQN